MIEHGLTIRDAAQKWVSEMNAFSSDMIEKLFGDWELVTEVTAPTRYRRVYVFSPPEGVSQQEGEIVNYLADADVYLVNLDDGTAVEVGRNDFDVLRDGDLPMWGTLWSFGDGCDDWWLEEQDGIRKMSECGFRIYEHEEYGYFFGIDGGGYSFYDEHWIPLYKARGLHWHDPETEDHDFVISEYRRADLYKRLLGYMGEMIPDKSQLVDVLTHLGFTEQELAYEGLGGDNG